MIVTEDSDEEKRYEMAKRTSSGQITLITRSFGRGVDFTCLDSTVLKNGGVHVIQTFFSQEPSEEIQIKGRTARQGNKGSFSFLLKKEDIIGDFGLSENETNTCIASVSCYLVLVEKRGKIYDNICQGKEKLAELKENDHKESMGFLSNIHKGGTKEVYDYLVAKNTYFQNIKCKSSKPLHIVMALDSSGSMGMNYKEPWYMLIEAVKFYLSNRIDSGHLDDIISIVIYDHSVRKVVTQQPIKDTLNNINSILQYYGGGTSFYEAIIQSHLILKATDLNKYEIAFLFLSDGADSTGDEEMVNLGKELGPKGIKTFTYAFGKHANGNKLENMAAIHGYGAKYLASDISRTETGGTGPNHSTKEAIKTLLININQ